MTNFPTSIDNFTTVTNNTLVENTHPDLHNDVSSAVEALQTKVGVDSSADANSQDYKVTQNTSHRNKTTGNPHNVTKSDVGLGNADNTSDVDKPISTAQQTALDLKADKSNVLELDNTATYTPTTDYEPATKKYVDDTSGGGGGSYITRTAKTKNTTYQAGSKGGILVVSEDYDTGGGLAIDTKVLSDSNTTPTTQVAKMKFSINSAVADTITVPILPNDYYNVSSSQSDVYIYFYEQ